MKKLTKGNANNYRRVLNVGYCELQSLLSVLDRVGYNSGELGWNWDLYNYGGVAIVTGYRNLPKGVMVSYAMAKRYNDLARGQSDDARLELLDQLIKEVF